MEIIERTDTKLKLYYKTPRPILFSIFGCFFIVAGLSSIFFSAKKTTLECSKIEADRTSCQIINTRFIGQDIADIFEGANLKRAKIYENESRNIDNENKIVLVTETEEILLDTQFNFGLEEVKIKVKKINNFIEEPNNLKLSISQDSRFFSVLVGFVFMALGSGIIIIALKQEKSEIFYTFDRPSKQLQITYKNLLNKTEVSQLDFQDLEKVVVRTENKGYRNDRADIHNLELVMKEKENFLLYSFIGNDLKIVADRIAKEIDRIIN